MKNKKSFYFKFICFFLFLTQITACQLKDAKVAKNQYVFVYTDHVGAYDSLIYKKFEKEEKIKVYIKKITEGTILEQIKVERHNSMADVILCNSYEELKVIRKNSLFFPLKSDKLKEAIDINYRSFSNSWFALSKTPLVIAYNKNFLKKDTIQSYYQLISSKWKGKIGIQHKNNETLKAFETAIKIVLKDKAYLYLQQFYKQVNISQKGDDLTQINSLRKAETFLALIQLSSLAKANEVAYQKSLKGNKAEYANIDKIMPIFPNQRKKGAYYKITGAGIYRYARNPENGQKLIEFLASKRAQYQFAAGRFEFPIIKNIAICFELEKFGKFRARFYHKRHKIKKRP